MPLPNLKELDKYAYGDTAKVGPGTIDLTALDEYAYKKPSEITSGPRFMERIHTGLRKKIGLEGFDLRRALTGIGKMGDKPSPDIRQQIGGLFLEALEGSRERTIPTPLAEGQTSKEQMEIIVGNVRKQVEAAARFPIDVAQQVFFDENLQARQPIEVLKEAGKVGVDLTEFVRQTFEDYSTYISPLASPEAKQAAVERIGQDPLNVFFATGIAKGGARQFRQLRQVFKPKARPVSVREAVGEVFAKKEPLTTEAEFAKAKGKPSIFEKPPVKKKIVYGKEELALKKELEKRGVTEKPAEIAMRYERSAQGGLPSIEDYLKSPTVHWRGKDAARILIKSSNPLKSAREFLRIVAEKKSTQDVSAKKAFDTFMKKPGDAVDILNDAVEVASVIAREDFRGIYNKRITAKGVTEKPAVKEPWEIPKEEYATKVLRADAEYKRPLLVGTEKKHIETTYEDALAQGLITKKQYEAGRWGGLSKKANERSVKLTAEANHEFEVQQALSEGKSPYKGWKKDYPELAKGVKGKVAPIPKELEGLAEEARKYDNYAAWLNDLTRTDRARDVIKKLYPMKKGGPEFTFESFWQAAQRGREIGKPVAEAKLSSAVLEKKRREVEAFAGKAELPRGAAPGSPQDLLKKSEIIKNLREALGVPIRTGRFREKAKGIYKRQPKVIRLKNATDLPTLSHEIGHHIEEIIFPKRVRRLEQIRKYQREVVALTREAGFPKSKQTRAEGFAEFIRLYITDPKKAQAKASTFYSYFEGKATDFPELQDILLQARRDVQRWVNQPATAKVLSQVSIGEREPSNVSINRIYTMAVDDIRPIQVAVKEMSGGKLPLDIAQDPFRQAWLLRGWTGKANAFLNYGVMDKGGNKIFPSMKEILKPVSDNLDAFRTYGVAKRALERSRRGFETGIDSRDAVEALAELSRKSPIYEQTFNKLVEFQDKILSYLSDAGVVGPEELGKLRKYSSDYIPFYRVFEETKVKGFRTGKGLANLTRPVKRFKGSGREIIDPLESIIKNVYAMVSIAERNKVAQTLVGLAEKTEGGGKWAEHIPAPAHGWQFKLEEIQRFLAEAGVKDADANVLAKIFRPSIFAPAKENILTVFREGKANFYQLQPDLYRAVLALDQETSGTLIKVLSKPARMLRAGATLTPEFSLYRNPFRDQMTALVYSKYHYRPVIDLARGLFHTIKRDDLYWKWQSSGGAHAALVSLDRNYLQGSLRTILRQRTGQILTDVVRHPIESLRSLSEFTEEATRMGEFKRGLEKGVSLREAALASRDVTLDFARVGAKGRIPNQLIAFFNAQVQGVDKMVRAFKENPTGSTVKAVAGITIPSLILYTFNRDNPRYKELATWRKDLFWNIPFGDRFISIPKPFELGIIFGSFPERLFEWVDSQDPEAFDDLAQNFWESLTPNVLPTALQPIIEVVANRSFFTGKPVVSEGRKRLIAAEQYSPYTPESFKAAGKRLGISPAKLEHLYRGYTAGLGRLPISMMEKLLFNPPERPSDIAYTPMLRGIVTPEPAGFRSVSVNKFYDFKEKVNRLHATWKSLSGTEATNFRKKHPEIKWNALLNKKGELLSVLRKQRQRAMDSSSFTVDEKKKRIQEIDKRVLKIVQTFLRLIKP